jgi:hypothetical protein
MSNAPTLNIREAIDEITLTVAHPGKNDLATEIEELTVAYMDRVLPTSALTDDEIERVIEAIVKGVLKRLEQIAIGGGQIGSA